MPLELARAFPCDDELVPRPVDVVVLGAGAVGASIAYHLARDGARVALLERSDAAAGATGVSFAWIGRDDEPASAQGPLRRLTARDYRRLEAELPGVAVKWHGSLAWGEAVSPGDLHAGARAVGRDELAALEPHLRASPPVARQVEQDGAVDPVALVRELLRAAAARGAQVRTGVEVTALRVRAEALVDVETPSGSWSARTVVVAAGAGAPEILRPLGFELPVSSSPALLLRFGAPPGLVRTLLSNDEFEVRELRDGELLAAREYDGEDTAPARLATGARILARLETALGCAGRLELLDVTVGRRPMPADGHPVIGWVPDAPGVYLAVMHSGVTFAATVGRLVSEEILLGRHADVLDGLRPSRFLRS